ncbi:MAG TPA: hypothetical protein VKY74_27530 [Chloroflexia bacterium]|nr:hypothetical protein [Chloroflexia bacterium]
MQLPPQGPAPQSLGRTLLIGALILAVAVLVWAAVPAMQAAPPAPLAPAPGPDPDTGFWIELLIVVILTSAAGIVMYLRRKPEL